MPLPKAAALIAARHPDLLPRLIGSTFATIIARVVTDEEWVEIQRRNVEYATTSPGACATHDFMDANEQMAEAFEEVSNLLGEDIIGGPSGDGTVEGVEFSADEERTGLWNAAWTYAKAEFLTGAPAMVEGLATPGALR